MQPSRELAVALEVVRQACAYLMEAYDRFEVIADAPSDITTDAGAAQKIADHLRAKYTDKALATEFPGAIAAVQEIFTKSIFPERKA